MTKEIGDSPFSMFGTSTSNLTVSDSTMYDLPTYIEGNISMLKTSMLNVNFEKAPDKMTVANSYVNDGRFQSLNELDNVTLVNSAVINSDYVNYSYLNGSSVTSNYISHTNINSTAITSNFASYVTLYNITNGQFTNISYSLILGYPPIYQNGSYHGYYVYMNNMYNDWVDLNYTNAELGTGEIPFMNIDSNSRSLNVNYTLITSTTVYFDPINGNNVSFNHDMWTNIRGLLEIYIQH